MTTQGAGFVKAERNGNIISPKGSGHNNGGTQVSELSSHEQIQERDLSEDEVVAELSEDGSATIREIEEEDNVVSVSVDRLNNSRLNRFFTEEELSSLRQKEEIVEGEDKPKDIDEVWSEIEELVSAHNRGVAKNKRRLERERIKEAYRDPALDKKMKNMTGEQMQRVMSDDNSSTVDEEELQEALESVEERYSSFLEESEPEIEDPSTQVEELDKGLEAWKDSDKEYWHDFVEDLQESDESTMFEAVGPNSKRVTTQDEEMKEALRNPENFNGTVELEEDSGSTVIAVVKED